MNVQQLRNPRAIRPQKLPLREISHLVIEPTMRCNMNCRSCYNRDRTQTKDLKEVKAEIDLGMKKRRLDTISLLGGEPTLHPDLPGIIAYIKSRKLFCQVLTNGLVLLNDPGSRLLDRMIQAGTDRIIFHVDSGQPQRHDNPDSVCRRLFDMAEQRRVWFGLSITIYPENQRSIPTMMKRYAEYRFFDGILATLTRDPSRTVRAASALGERLELVNEYEAISSELQVEPAAYLPTSLDDRDISWLIYFYYINQRTGRTYQLPPRLSRSFRQGYRLFMGREMFGPATSPAWFPLGFLSSSLLANAMRPGLLGRYRNLLRGSKGLSDLRFHYIVLQQGPEFNPAYNQVQMCYHCPDATIRNGMLTPVCLADRISPLSPDPQSLTPDIDQELRETVYRHLGEI